MNPIIESHTVNETLVDDRSREPGGSSIAQGLVEPAEAKKSVMGWLVKALMLVVVVLGGVVFGLYKMRVDIPSLNTTRLYAQLDTLSAQRRRIL